MEVTKNCRNHVGDKCVICNKVCSSPWLLERHRKRCQHAFQIGFTGSESCLDKNAQGPENPLFGSSALYRCGICSKTYSQKDDLKRHMEVMKMHEDHGGNTCDVCKPECLAAWQLEKHRKAQVLQVIEKFKCWVCSKVFTKQQEFDIHVE